ncbi:molecular chaperone [Halobacteriaceae archaeon GCM10025711]
MTQQATADRSDAAATEFAVLAECWRQPDERLAAALDAGLFDEVSAADASLADLRVEHSRLFVGPGDHPCPPYESVYRDRDPGQEFGQVLGAATDAVERWYREYGLAPDETWTDLPDHVAVELEFAGYLAATGEDDALERFVDEHPGAWLPEFLDRVEAATTEPFYRALARVTRDRIGRGGE